MFMWSIHVLTYKNDLFFLIALWCALINFIKVNFTNNKMHLLLNIWLEFWNMYALTWPPTHWRHRTLTSPQKIILCYFIVWTTSPLHCMPHWSYFLPNLSFWKLISPCSSLAFKLFSPPLLWWWNGIFWMAFYFLPELMSAYCHLFLYLLSFYIKQFRIAWMCKVFTSSLCVCIKF